MLQGKAIHQRRFGAAQIGFDGEKNKKRQSCVEREVVMDLGMVGGGKVKMF